MHYCMTWCGVLLILSVAGATFVVMNLAFTWLLLHLYFKLCSHNDTHLRYIWLLANPTSLQQGNAALMPTSWVLWKRHADSNA